MDPKKMTDEELYNIYRVSSNPLSSNLHNADAVVTEMYRRLQSQPTGEILNPCEAVMHAIREFVRKEVPKNYINCHAAPEAWRELEETIRNIVGSSLPGLSKLCLELLADDCKWIMNTAATTNFQYHWECKHCGTLWPWKAGSITLCANTDCVAVRIRKILEK